MESTTAAPLDTRLPGTAESSVKGHPNSKQAHEPQMQRSTCTRTDSLCLPPPTTPPPTSPPSYNPNLPLSLNASKPAGLATCQPSPFQPARLRAHMPISPHAHLPACPHALMPCCSHARMLAVPLPHPGTKEEVMRASMRSGRESNWSTSSPRGEPKT